MRITVLRMIDPQRYKTARTNQTVIWISFYLFSPFPRSFDPRLVFTVNCSTDSPGDRNCRFGKLFLNWLPTQSSIMHKQNILRALGLSISVWSPTSPGITLPCIVMSICCYPKATITHRVRVANEQTCSNNINSLLSLFILSELNFESFWKVSWPNALCLFMTFIPLRFLNTFVWLLLFVVSFFCTLFMRTKKRERIKD